MRNKILFFLMASVLAACGFLSPTEGGLEKPCPLMDPINLKLGKVLVSYPAKLDPYVYEAKDHPKYPRRIIRETGQSYQICDDNKPYHHASGVYLKAVSSNNWSRRSDTKSWVPVGVFNGVNVGQPSAPKSQIEQTGYKEDISKCYNSEKINHEGCWIYRYLEDVDLTISAKIATTSVNVYGKPVRTGEQHTREDWPVFMDQLEVFWRSMILEIKDE